MSGHETNIHIRFFEKTNISSALVDGEQTALIATNHEIDIAAIPAKQQYGRGFR